MVTLCMLRRWTGAHVAVAPALQAQATAGCSRLPGPTRRRCDASTLTRATASEQPMDRVPREEVKQVARALRKSGAHPHEVTEQLQWWAGYADVECFNQLLHELAVWREWKLVQAAVEAMPAAGVQPDVITYTELMAALSRAGRPRDALAAFDRMTAAAVAADSAAFAAALRAAVAAHQPHRALKLHDDMISHGCTLTLHTLEPLAAACRDACDLPRARALLATCGEQGLRPSDRAVADIVGCCTAVGDWDAAEGVWATAEKLGVDTPARFPLAYLSKCGLVIARQRSGAALAEVMAVYQPINKHVEGATADSKEQRWDTAEAVLLAAGRSREDQATTALSCERAVEMFRRMLAAGHRPSVTTYAATVTICCRDERWADAVAAFQAASAHGCRVHAYAYPPSTSEAAALSDDERSARGYQRFVRECTAHDQWALFATALTQLVAADDAAAAAADPATLASDGYQRLAAAGSALRFAHDIASQSAAGTCAVEWVAAQVARAESAGVGAHPLTALAAMAAFHSLGAHTEGEQRYRGLVAAVQSDSGASARRRRRRQRQRASKAGSGGALG